MVNEKKMLLQWVDEDRNELVDFFSRFIRAKSPNPPGDTREAADVICRFLNDKQLPYQKVAPQSVMPNIVGNYHCGSPGRHLVLNGHIDVFPVGDEKWTHDPWGGKVVDGRVYGRGACDMKCGTSASILTFAYIYRIREKLRGQLTLTAVSDEETLGPYGARYLFDKYPELHGDCLLNGEPSNLNTIRFGEKGSVWLAFTVRTVGAAGAYTHLSASATKIAGRLIADLEGVTSIKSSTPGNVTRALDEAEEAIEKALGKGASQVIRAVTLNIGSIHGGLKVNMLPSKCVVEADIRLPIGVEKVQITKVVEDILSHYPEVTVEEICSNPSNWCDPCGEMAQIIQTNVKDLKGYKPLPIISLANCDARLWRYKNIPGYVYGPPPRGMGSSDEYVEAGDFIHVVKTHVLSAYDYLSRS